MPSLGVTPQYFGPRRLGAAFLLSPVGPPNTCCLSERAPVDFGHGADELPHTLGKCSMPA